MPKTPTHKSVPWRPKEERHICALADMPVNAARGFTLYGAHDDEKLELIVWRSVLRFDAAAETNELAAFVNQCPHMGLPLETFPDKFLSADGQSLICSAHGARFRFDGVCFAGPCNGQSLHRVALTLRDGQIIMLP
jgi:nitrite reductase/ring-hydroxylating ferredoxin subunit